MNTNSFFNQAAAISIPNGNQGSSLSQPIDIAYQRSGSVFNNNSNFPTSNQSQQQHQQQQNQNQIQQMQQNQQHSHQQQQQQQNQHQHQPQNHNNYLSTNSININVNPNQRSFRRDSIAHSQGVGGISWGSVTIGSWLKDEVMMHNNFNLGSTNAQISMSPPIQSAYLPDLEANYCKDYSCCGQLLPTLHDLLKHYEESHISPTPPTHQPKPIQNFDTVSTTDVFINSNNNNNNMNNVNQKQQNTFGFNQSPFQQQNIQQQLRQQLQGSNNNSSSSIHQQQQHHSPHPQQQQNHHIQQQSQQQQQQQQQNYQLHQNLNNPQQVNVQDSQFLQSNNNQNTSSQQSTPFPMSLSNDDSAMDLDEEMDEGYIDDPSRNLYVAQGNEKPFTCPVIGCNKTYKNQNGLKYHRLHGHQNQKLHLNPDGTYSVIDPNDGNGMEQDKPYRCEVCGKRYKNLNGLKYHRGHSTH